MKNQELDQYFRKNAQNQSFDFDESYWSEMEMLLEQEEQDKKGGFWQQWMGFIVLGLVFVAGTIVVWNFHPKNAAKNHPAISNTPPKAINPSIDSHSTHPRAINITSQPIQSSTHPNTPVNTPQINSNIIKNNIQQYSYSKNKQHKTTAPKAIEQPLSKVNTHTHTVNSIKDLQNNHPAMPRIDSINAINYQLSDSANFSQKTIAQKTPFKTIENKPTIQSDEWGYLEGIPMALLFIKTGKLPTLVAQKNTKQEDQPTASRPTLQLSVGLIGGGNLYRGYLNTGEQNAPMATKAFGGAFVAARPFSNPNIQTSIGLNYWERGALNSFIQADSVVYGFGATTYSNNVTVQRVQYLEVPINVAFQLKKGQVFTGLQLHYMLNATGQLQQTVSDAFQQQTAAAISQKGYQSVFRKLDMSVALGYEYPIATNFLLGGQLQTGLLDVTSNDVFNNSVIDRNTQFRIFIRYELGWQL